jgi:hypothetical protein
VSEADLRPFRLGRSGGTGAVTPVDRPGTQQPPRDPGLTPGGPTTPAPVTPLFPQPLQPTLPGATVPVTPPKKPGGGSPM